MSNAELIDRLCDMLSDAVDIIRKQQEIIIMHEIEIPEQIAEKAKSVVERRNQE